jgi:CRISPR-associated protein Cmx8
MATRQAKSKAAEPIKSVTIRYDLFDLPTAQHKAGLAGLVLAIRSLRERAAQAPDQILPESVPEILGEVTDVSVEVRFTPQSLQGLLDDVYDARQVEAVVKSKWSGAAPKRVEEVEEEDPDTKMRKKIKRFVYDTVKPTGSFLPQFLPAMEEDKGWLKLWRDMLWAIPRGNPQSRLPYEQRSRGEPCKEGKLAWDDLVKVAAAREKNEFHVAEVAGSLWLGAQAFNAESIPFRGRAERNLLLHFWPLTSLIFVPQAIDADGKTEFVGYVLAIPEVAGLKRFCALYPRMLTGLGDRIRGFRPAGAVIDLPAQGALEFLEDLASVVGDVGREALSRAVSAVEFVHLDKQGNNVKSLSAGRVSADANLLLAYRDIVGSPDRVAKYSNPLFRAKLIQALLDQLDWYVPFGPALAKWPWTFFIRSLESPRYLPWFWVDAAARFQLDADKHQQDWEVYQTMSARNPTLEPPTSHLAPLINRMIRQYVIRKTEAKTGLEWDKLKEKKTPEGKFDIPKNWIEAKEKVASDAFLAARSRREQDFVDFFTATFCQFKQFLSEEDFCVVANALLDESGVDKVKTLTMLALSANS